MPATHAGHHQTWHLSQQKDTANSSFLFISKVIEFYLKLYIKWINLCSLNATFTKLRGFFWTRVLFLILNLIALSTAKVNRSVVCFEQDKFQKHTGWMYFMLS